LPKEFGYGRQRDSIYPSGGFLDMNLEGKKAPSFSLEGNDGKKHFLDAYKGKTVVMFFYPKDSTPG
jgi:AhpC/TSA family